MRTTDLSHSSGKPFISYTFTHPILQSQDTYHNTSHEEEGQVYKIVRSRRPKRCWIITSWRHSAKWEPF